MVRSGFSSKPLVSPQHVDEVDLKDETSLSKYDDEEYNVVSFNGFFPFNIYSVNDSKLHTDNDDDDDKINMKQFSRDTSTEPLPNVIMAPQSGIPLRCRDFMGVSQSASQNLQNVAFMSSNSTNSNNNTNKADNIAYGVSAAHTQSNLVNSTSVDNLSDVVIYAFLTSQPNSPQLAREDLKQIDPDDLEEMDLYWEMAMLTIKARRFIKRTGKKLDMNGQRIGFDRSKVECYNCHKHGYFSRECRASRNQESRGRESGKRTVLVETPTENALIAQDGIGGYDWSYQAQEEHPTNFALMAYTSSGSSSGSDSEVDSCTTTCVKAYATLKEKYDSLSSDYKKSQFNLVSYKAGLESLEARLADYKKNEAVFEESIIVLNLKNLTIRNNFGSPIIKDWSSDDESDVDVIPKVETVRPSTKEIKYVKPGRETVEKKEYKEKGVFDSGCSRHMIGNKCYLSGYEDYDGGFVSFGDGKGRISSKDKIKSRALVFDDEYFYKELKYNLVLIKREFSVARTPQQNGVAKRKNKTLVEAARTMVLVIKPHNKTPYELICGRTPFIDFMKPFGCPVTILNTKDNLGKFDGKDDKGYFVGYFVVSKAMRVFNKRTRIVEETLNIRFLENAPNLTGNGPVWLYDVDSLSKSINCVTVVVGNQTNNIAGVRDNIVAGQATKTVEPEQEYILIPFCTTNQLSSQGSKHCEDDVGLKPTEVDESVVLNRDDKVANDAGKKSNENRENKCDKNNQTLRDESERLIVQERAPEINTNNTNSVTAASSSFNVAQPMNDTSLLDDPFMHDLEDIGIFDDAYDDQDVGADADFNNLDSTMIFSPIPITRIHKDHLVSQIIGDLQRTNHKDFQNCLFACFLSQIEPKKVYMNKKDERGIMVRNKARLVTQGYTQEDRIDYDEVFAPVDRIEAVRLFLAYASFMNFIVYQMDMKSVFLYGKIDEEVYVCQPLGFEDPEFPDKVYKVEKALYGLHQAPRAWYETLSTYLLDNRFQRGTIDKTLFIKRIKSDILLVQ
ncbi:putative ribonuclease H-like domain-containing protein, partial [Tanacetum coccineum]